MVGLRIFNRARAFAILVCLESLVTGCTAVDSIEDVRALQERGGFEESIEPIRSLLRRSGAEYEAELNYRLGMALRRIGTPSQAVWPLAKASEDPEWYWMASIELAECALESGNTDLALRTTSEMLKRNETHFRAWLLSAEARVVSHSDLEQALREVERAREIQPDSYAARLTEASVLLMLGRAADAEAAIAAVEKAVISKGLGESELGRLCATRAILSSEMNDQEVSATRLSQCLEQFPIDPSVVETAVMLYRSWQQPDRAREALSRALRLDPGSLSYRLALASELREDGRTDEAAALLSEATRLPHESQRQAAWTALAAHFLAQKRYADAAEAMERSLELDPEPDALDLLAHADLLAMAGDHAAARRAAKRIDRAEFRDLVEGRILLHEQEPERALEALDRALAIWPDNAAARYYAARAAEQAGNLPRAISEYRQSIRADAGFTDAGLRLARFHLAQGNLPAARRAAQHHFQSHPADVESALLLGQISLRENQQISPEVLGRLVTSAESSHWTAIHAEYLARRGDVDGALALLDQAAQRSASEISSLDLVRARITILIADGRRQEARAFVDRMSGEAVESATRHELEGLLLRADGALEKACESFAEAVRLSPESESAWTSLGECSRHLGESGSAIAAFDRAGEMSKEPWEPRRRAAEIAIEQGDLVGAQARLRALLREHPFDTRSVYLLGELCLEQSDCRADVPGLARQMAFLGAPADARSLQERFAATPAKP